MLDRIRASITKKQSFKYNIEYFNKFNGIAFVGGWAYFENASVAKISYLSKSGRWKKTDFKLLDSHDVAIAHGNQIANQARFFIKIADNLPENILDLKLKFESGGLISNQVRECRDLHLHGIERGPYRNFVPHFFRDYVTGKGIKTVLEIGSRARSSVNNKETYLPSDIEFTGVDIVPGECVDVVCDAHQLSQYVAHNKYELVYSLNVFEHLLMPWKVVLEINKVMKTGGVVMIFTHHTFPLHDLPWDYYRFSDQAWYAMFNKATGFEIIKTELIDPVSIVPNCIYEGSKSVKHGEAYIHSAVIARKICTTKLNWPVDSQEIINTEYPQ
jgi:SAM-dependent methyltransferase